MVSTKFSVMVSILFVFSVLVSCEESLGSSLDSEGGGLTNYNPSTKVELKAIIANEIAARGNTATLNNIDVSQLTDFSYVFKGMKEFNGDISRWDVGNATNLEGMFYGAEKFNSNISNWNTIKAQNMRRMFKKASAFNRDISLWDVSSVTDMRGMFYGASAFNQDIGRWDPSKVTDMAYMFKNTTALTDKTKLGWTGKLGAVAEASAMFDGTSGLSANTPDWYAGLTKECTTTSTPDNRSALLKDANLTTANAKCIDTTKVVDFESIYYGKTFNQDIGNWDTSNVSSMRRMFKKSTTFNQVLPKWDVQDVTDMRGMFYGATAFGQDLSGWDIRKVRDVAFMFKNATAFSDKTKLEWADKLGAVTDAIAMFDGTSGLKTNPPDWYAGLLSKVDVCKNVSISTPTSYKELLDNTNLTNEKAQCIDTTNITKLTDTSASPIAGLFTSKLEFNGDISNWDVHNVTSMERMFFTIGASYTNFNQDIGGWDVSNVTNMNLAFVGLAIFDQDLSSWDVSSVTNMGAIFYSSLEFTNAGVSLDGWDVSSVPANKWTGVVFSPVYPFDFTGFAPGSGQRVAREDQVPSWCTKANGCVNPNAPNAP